MYKDDHKGKDFTFVGMNLVVQSVGLKRKLLVLGKIDYELG